jgi:hypothetical protein
MHFPVFVALFNLSVQFALLTYELLSSEVLGYGHFF